MFKFYKKYIPGYSRIIILVNRLILKNTTLLWTAVEQEAIDTLREGLKNAPFMEYLNVMGTFTLETDASG